MSEIQFEASLHDKKLKNQPSSPRSESVDWTPEQDMLLAKAMKDAQERKLRERNGR